MLHFVDVAQAYGSHQLPFTLDKNILPLFRSSP
jgi:hypothetical protein